MLVETEKIAKYMCMLYVCKNPFADCVGTFLAVKKCWEKCELASLVRQPPQFPFPALQYTIAPGVPEHYKMSNILLKIIFTSEKLVVTLYLYFLVFCIAIVAYNVESEIASRNS